MHFLTHRFFCATRFLFLVFPHFCVSVPCARLSWPYCQLSSTRKYILSYHLTPSPETKTETLEKNYPYGFPVTQPTVSKHWWKHTAWSTTSLFFSASETKKTDGNNWNLKMVVVTNVDYLHCLSKLVCVFFSQKKASIQCFISTEVFTAFSLTSRHHSVLSCLL